MHLGRWLVLFVAAAVALGGCGDDDEPVTTSSTIDIGFAGPAPRPAVAPGCTSEYPNKIQNTGWAGGLFTTCASEDFTSFHVTNDSALVLSVRQSTSRTMTMQVTRPLANSFADAAVNQAQPASCTTLNGPCTLPPGSELVANDFTPVALYFDVLPAETTAVTAAAMFGRFAEAKLRGRAWSLMSGIQTCASNAATAARENVDRDDVVRHGVDTALACGSVWRQIYSELGTERPPPARPSEQLLKYAGEFGKNFGTDVTVTLLRIAHR